MIRAKLIAVVLTCIMVNAGLAQVHKPVQTLVPNPPQTLAPANVRTSVLNPLYSFEPNKLDAAKKQIVLLNNNDKLVPFREVSKMNIAVLYLSESPAQVEGSADRKSIYRIFDSIANKYWKVTSFFNDEVITDSVRNILHDKLKLFDHVIFYITGNKGADDAVTSIVSSLAIGHRAVAVVNADKERLLQCVDLQMPLIWMPAEGVEAASVSAQVIFGGVPATNKLQAAIGKKFKKGQGDLTGKIRLGYSVPASVALNEGLTFHIDSIAEAGIATHAAPGVVVLLVKNGQVIFDKAYGKQTYESVEPLRPTDIFDMASVTKVTATTPAIMRMFDKKQLSLDSPISAFVHVLRNYPDKREQTVMEALLHEAGFTPYIKFYEKLGPLDLSFHRSEAFPTGIADNFFLRRNYFEEVMWPVTLQSPVLTRGKFVYSDVSMYMMKEVVENITHRKLDEYVLNDLYLPLGMQSTGYLPRLRFDKSRIVPTTENDNWLRNMRVTGFVNDPGAAMAGGVEGHAGLFSTSNDLAIYYQTLLNKGAYGGVRFFETNTVELFTSRQSKVSTRGLGFAKPVDSIVPAVGYPSASSFGHSGYTGTYVWVDPGYDMIYICLTNRVYPDDGKTYGPAKVNIRAQVLDVFYKAIVSAIP